MGTFGSDEAGVGRMSSTTGARWQDGGEGSWAKPLFERMAAGMEKMSLLN